MSQTAEVFIVWVDPPAGDVTTAKNYDTNANHHKLKQRGERSNIIVKKNRIAPEMIALANPNSHRQRPNIERKSAEQKKYHGLRKVRYWGVAKVGTQVLLTCIAVRHAHRPEQGRRVVNCKNIVRLLSAGLGPSSGKLGAAVG